MIDDMDQRKDARDELSIRIKQTAPFGVHEAHMTIFAQLKVKDLIDRIHDEMMS